MTLKDVSLITRKFLVSLLMYAVVVGFFFGLLSAVNHFSTGPKPNKEAIHPTIIDG